MFSAFYTNTASCSTSKQPSNNASLSQTAFSAVNGSSRTSPKFLADLRSGRDQKGQSLGFTCSLNSAYPLQTTDYYYRYAILPNFCSLIVYAFNLPQVSILFNDGSGPQFSPTLSVDIILPSSSSNRPLDSSTDGAISQPSRDALTSFVFSLPCSCRNDECCRHQPPQFCHWQ
jgi:hypothetical protein